MDADFSMSPSPSASANPIPARPCTGGSSSSTHSQTMHQDSRRARSASTSSSVTNFPSSYDAFGLAASPSAHSPKHSWLATRPMAYPPQWASAGPGLPPMPLGTSPTTSGGMMAGSTMSYMAPPMELTLPSPSQHAQSHGVLPSASLMGGSTLRLNRPSLLSLQTSAEDEEIRHGDPDGTRAHETINEEITEDIGAEETDMDNTAAEFVQRWRNRLEPSPTIRRVQSACGTPRQGSVSPFAMNAINDPGSGSGSGSVSPTARLPISLRRASSDQSTGTRPDFKLILDGMRRDGNGGGDSARAAEAHGLPIKGRDKGKGKEKMCFSSGGSNASREGQSLTMPQTIPDGKRVSARLPPNLRATLAAEKDIAGQEIRSEALLQRLILSNPSSLPITPRPSRYHRKRAMSTFSSALSQSSDSMSDGSSDEDGPFEADDVLERETTPAMEPGWHPGMEVEMMTPGPSLNGGMQDTPTRFGTLPPVYDAGLAVRRGPSGRSSLNSLNSFGGMKVDERDNVLANSMTWRGSPSAGTRSAKRKATFEDSRYEPYGKRLRGPSSDAGGPTSHSASLSHSPLQWHSTLPSVPMSPMSSSGMDYESSSARSYSRPRSRAGSPGLISGMQMQMMTRPGASSPATSSPLNTHGSGGLGGAGSASQPPLSSSSSTSNGMSTGNAISSGRPIVGMGGLGMLLLNKRNVNSISTGMGLVGKNGGLGEGEAAVAERMGGMDFAAGGENGGPRRVSAGASVADSEDEDKMMFD